MIENDNNEFGFVDINPNVDELVEDNEEENIENEIIEEEPVQTKQNDIFKKPKKMPKTAESKNDEKDTFNKSITKATKGDATPKQGNRLENLEKARKKGLEVRKQKAEERRKQKEEEKRLKEEEKARKREETKERNKQKARERYYRVKKQKEEEQEQDEKEIKEKIVKTSKKPVVPKMSNSKLSFEEFALYMSKYDDLKRRYEKEQAEIKRRKEEKNKIELDNKKVQDYMPKNHPLQHLYNPVIRKKNFDFNNL